MSDLNKADVEQLLLSLNDDFFKNMDKEMSLVEPDIEPDPSIATIKALLGEVPAQVEYLKVRSIEVRKKIQQVKLAIKAKKINLDLQKSHIRQEYLEKYQMELKEYITSAKTLFEDVATGKKKLPNSVLQEMLKAIKPEKPTQNNLDDLANLKTESIQKEILIIEKQVNDYEELYSILSTMAEKYENKNLAVRAHKGLLEAEMRNQIN